METSLFIAKLFGPYCLVVALGILLNRQAYQRLMEDFCRNAALVYFGGVLALIIGLVIVLTHNLWVASWVVIITIFGWSGLIKGIWLIVFPGGLSKFIDAYRRNSTILTVHMIGVFVIGVVLTIFGYFVR